MKRNSTPLKNSWNNDSLLSASCFLVIFLLPLLAFNVVAQTNVPVRSVDELKKFSLEDLLDIEVTSVSRHPEKLSDAPSAIQVITGDEIRRSGATSIPEALRLASNLQIAQKNSHEWVITARGFSSDVANKLLVMIDGRTVYTPLFSGVFWDRQDYLLEDIDRIEVISGPGGSLWGANAVNGVINIKTKSAKETQGVYVEAGGGTMLEDFAGVRYGGTLASNVYFRVYGKYFDRGEEVFANGKNAPDSWRMGQGGFRIDAEPSTQNTFTLQGDLYSGEEGITTGGTGKSSGGNLLGRVTHTISDESDIVLQLYYDRTHLALPTPAFALAPAGTLKDDLDTYDADFQHRFPIGERNRIVWGLGYRVTHDVVENSPSLAFFPTTLNQNLFSAFVQDEIALVPDKLNLTLGTKVEHNDYTGFEVEPSGRLQWNVTTNQMVWGAVSRAVRMPSRIDRDLSQPAPGYTFVALEGGDDFRSETVIAYELGYRAQLYSKVAGSISTFYNDYDHVRSASASRNPTIPGLPFPLFFENNLEAQTYGFEISADYQLLDWWKLRAGYTLLKEDVDVKSGKVDFNNGLNETADPQQQISFNSSMDLPGNLQLDGHLRWVDQLIVNNSGKPATVPSYFEMDIRLAWRPVHNLELSIVGQNLLHDHHPEFGAPSPLREEIIRSVYGKVAWSF